ncbi:hypothetical protein Scep_014478 [Stephania cephalantha]|uniref:Uncharacterized protein n=1 Tax=Stephania cephalantha TaxID=152367 RepID=A0AAP0NZF3_9MAGN
MEGLSHLGVQCKTARDKVDDNDEQRRWLHDTTRLSRGEGFREAAATRRRGFERRDADGEGFEAAATATRRGLRRRRRRGEASEAEWRRRDGTTSGRPDDNSQSQSQRQQRPQPPADGAEISGFGREISRLVPRLGICICNREDNRLFNLDEKIAYLSYKVTKKVKLQGRIEEDGEATIVLALTPLRSFDDLVEK